MKKAQWLHELDEPAVGVPRGWSVNKAAKSSVPTLVTIGYIAKLSLTFRAFRDSIRVAASLAGYKPLMYACPPKLYPLCNFTLSINIKLYFDYSLGLKCTHRQSVSQATRQLISLHLNPQPHLHHGLFCL
jgi:hypothetical protein